MEASLTEDQQANKQRSRSAHSTRPDEVRLQPLSCSLPNPQTLAADRGDHRKDREEVRSQTPLAAAQHLDAEQLERQLREDINDSCAAAPEPEDGHEEERQPVPELAAAEVRVEARARAVPLVPAAHADDQECLLPL